MDDQHKSVSLVTAAVIPQSATTPSKSNISDADAQALLAVSHLQPQRSTSNDTKKVWLYIGLGIVLLIVVVVASLLSHKTNNPASKSGTGLPNATNNPLNNGGSINSQVQYCSNPVNASTVC